MTNSEERVQQALAAHLEHAELGGPAPDTSHLGPDEITQLEELIGLLDSTEGIAFGSGLGVDVGEVASTPAGERLVAALREALPPGTRVARDPGAGANGKGPEITEGWIVGTFGGRVRLWLLGDGVSLESSDGWLRVLERVFRLYPDTVAIALVDTEGSCLLVQPEDCAPRIEVPRGALVGRRYRRPILPAGEALSRFLDELIPYWEPMKDIREHTDHTVDVASIAKEQAIVAIEEQVAAGGRARKTNPKRKALTELGEGDVDAVTKLVDEIHDGRADLDTIETTLKELATRR